MLVAGLFTFGLAIWLACYVLARRLGALGVFAAGALLSYAAGTALAMLAIRTPDRPLDALVRALLLLALLLWTRAVIALLDDAPPQRLLRGWRFGALPLFLLGVILLTLMPDSTFLGVSARALATLVILAPALVINVLVATSLTDRHTAGWVTVMLVFTVFFLSSATILMLDLLPRFGSWPVIVAGLDLCLLGAALAGIRARQAGEAMLRDFIRSFDGSLVAALLFGAPLLLAAGGMPQQAAGLTALLAVITLAIASQALNSFWQQALDRFSLRAVPSVRAERAQLRAAADALPRQDLALAPDELEETEFVKLVRRGLSAYGNLPKLAASPLIRLHIVSQALTAGEEPDSTLARATILRTLLGQAIEALRPNDNASFQSGEEWRFYNALYYPYVVGMKPYSRRADHSHLDAQGQAALDWLRTYVPERTLYNWQNAAAALVARHLREQKPT